MDNKTNYYNIIKTTPLTLTLQAVDDVEKVTDHFITEDGLNSNNWKFLKYTYNSPNNEHYRVFYKSDEIYSILEEWAEMIPEKAACTSRTTPRIRSLLNDFEAYQLNYVVPYGFKVVGSRIYDIEKERERQTKLEHKKYKEHEERIKKQKEIERLRPYIRPEKISETDHNNLNKAIHNLVRIKYNLQIYSTWHDNQPKEKALAKRLFNWQDINREARKFIPKKQQQQDIKFLKQLWDNPISNSGE